MSTKIYNGYCIERNLSILELSEFQKEVQKMMQDYIYERFCQLYGKVVQNLVDKLTTLGINARKEGNTIIENEICNLLSFTEKSLQAEIKDVIRGKKSKKKTICSYSNADYYTIESVAYEYLCKRIEAAKILFEKSPYDLTSDICIFPAQEKCLFMAFGLADEFFRTLLKSKEHAKFAQKWVLKEYHYQNQTDRPEEISEEEWEIREKDWEKALEHSCIPEKSGLMIHFFNDVTDLFEYYSELKEKNYKDALKHIPDGTTRLNTFAKNSYINDAIAARRLSNPAFTVSKIIEINNECRKNSNFEPYSDKYEFLEITPDLLKKSVLDFIPV